MWTDNCREKYKTDGQRYPSDLTDADLDIIKRNCSPPGEQGFYASRDSGTPSRVRRMA